MDLGRIGRDPPAGAGSFHELPPPLEPAGVARGIAIVLGQAGHVGRDHVHAAQRRGQRRIATTGGRQVFFEVGEQHDGARGRLSRCQMLRGLEQGAAYVGVTRRLRAAAIVRELLPVGGNEALAFGRPVGRGEAQQDRLVGEAAGPDLGHRETVVRPHEAHRDAQRAQCLVDLAEVALRHVEQAIDRGGGGAALLARAERQGGAGRGRGQQAGVEEAAAEFGHEERTVREESRARTSRSITSGRKITRS